MSPVFVSILVVLFSAPSLVIPAQAATRSGKRMSVSDLLTTSRVGHWIQLQGEFQKDGTVRCTDAKPLTGDFLDDDWVLKGRIRSIDVRRHRFTVEHFEVRVDDDTAFEKPDGSVAGLDDLRPGMLVEAEGKYLRARIFLAQEVDDESNELRRGREAEKRILIVGKIEAVDSALKRITVMGTVFQMIEGTQVRSAIQ